MYYVNILIQQFHFLVFSLENHLCAQGGMYQEVFWNTFVSLKNSNQATRHQHKNRQIKHGIAILCNTDIIKRLKKIMQPFYGKPFLLRKYWDGGIVLVGDHLFVYFKKYRCMYLGSV